MPKLSLTSVLLALIFLFPTNTLAQDSSGQQKNVPAVVAAVAPEFPPIAQAAHASGEVVIEVKINADGQVSDTKAISGHPLLRKVSDAAARKWKFDSGEDQRGARLVFAFGYVDGKKSDPEFTITFLPAYKVEVICNPRLVLNRMSN